LFIGDVGRPDLIGSKGFTAEHMAGLLYDSLHEKILNYPDNTEVYPAHGAGSLCGKSLSKETWSTLGNQRQFNYALQPMHRDEFIKLVASNQPEVPMYFPRSAAKNLEGSASLSDLPRPRHLSSEEIRNFDGIVVDVRQNGIYGAGHVPNSINIGLGGQFASWAGTMIPIGTQIAVVADSDEQVDEAFIRLARVGHETVSGYILMMDYKGDTKRVSQISAEETNDMRARGVQLVDVRRSAEYASGHAAGAANFPLDKLSQTIHQLDPQKPTYVICQSGYRSSVGTSILENAGFNELYNVKGGTAAWIKAALPVESSETACAVTK
jgi:hydroxyacylglutathione hydrolase